MAPLRAGRRAAHQIAGHAGTLGVVLHRDRQFLHGAGRLLEMAGLIVAALLQKQVAPGGTVGGVGDAFGAVADLAHGVGERGAYAIQRAQQLAQFVVALHIDAGSEIAIGQSFGQGDAHVQRTLDSTVQRAKGERASQEQQGHGNQRDAAAGPDVAAGLEDVSGVALRLHAVELIDVGGDCSGRFHVLLAEDHDLGQETVGECHADAAFPVVELSAGRLDGLALNQDQVGQRAAGGVQLLLFLRREAGACDAFPHAGPIAGVSFQPVQEGFVAFQEFRLFGGHESHHIARHGLREILVLGRQAGDFVTAFLCLPQAVDAAAQVEYGGGHQGRQYAEDRQEDNEAFLEREILVHGVHPGGRHARENGPDPARMRLLRRSITAR